VVNRLTISLVDTSLSSTMVAHRSHPPSPAIASGPLHPPTHTLEQGSHVPVTMLLYNRLVLSLKHALSVEGDKLYCQVKVPMDGREVFKGRYIFGGPHACEHLICLWWYKYMYSEILSAVPTLNHALFI